MESFSKLKAKETATDHHIRNVRNWFDAYGEQAIDPDEQHFRDHEGDVFTMLPSPRAYPLVAALHNSKFVRRLFRLKKRSDRVESPSTIYTSNTGLETLAAFVSLVVGLGMTFGSIWWLNFVDSTVYRLAIITASGTLLTLIAWAAAGNKPFEILAAFAAYMAVLMIYRQVESSAAAT